MVYQRVFEIIKSFYNDNGNLSRDEGVKAFYEPLNKIYTDRSNSAHYPIIKDTIDGVIPELPGPIAPATIDDSFVKKLIIDENRKGERIVDISFRFEESISGKSFYLVCTKKRYSGVLTVSDLKAKLNITEDTDIDTLSEIFEVNLIDPDSDTLNLKLRTNENRLSTFYHIVIIDVNIHRITLPFTTITTKQFSKRDGNTFFYKQVSLFQNKENNDLWYYIISMYNINNHSFRDQFCFMIFFLQCLIPDQFEQRSMPTNMNTIEDVAFTNRSIDDSLDIQMDLDETSDTLSNIDYEQNDAVCKNFTPVLGTDNVNLPNTVGENLILHEFLRSYVNENPTLALHANGVDLQNSNVNSNVPLNNSDFVLQAITSVTSQNIMYELPNVNALNQNNNAFNMADNSNQPVLDVNHPVQINQNNLMQNSFNYSLTPANPTLSFDFMSYPVELNASPQQILMDSSNIYQHYNIIDSYVNQPNDSDHTFSPQPMLMTNSNIQLPYDTMNSNIYLPNDNDDNFSLLNTMNSNIYLPNDSDDNFSLLNTMNSNIYLPNDSDISFTSF